MNIALYLARRISPGTSKRRGTPAVKVAVAAVALSAAIMLAAIAIVAGFKREITAKVVGFNSHISMYAAQDDYSDSYLVSLTPSLRKLLDDAPYISDYSLTASIPAIFKTKSDFQGVYFKSLCGEGIREFMRSNLIEGHIPDYPADSISNDIVISRITARRLGLKTGDRIDTYFIGNDLKVRPLKVAGIFDSHFDTYDKIYAYGSLPLIQKLGDIRSDQGTSLAIHTPDFTKIDEYTTRLFNTLTEAMADGTIYRPYRLDNAFNQGQGYFQWLSLLDTNVVVVLTLMTFVAIITLISALLIIILDKKRFIGLLRALGMETRKVRRIFIYLAIKITVIGLVIGNAVMLTLLEVQSSRHFLKLDPESYYIDFVPVELSLSSVLILNAGIIAVVWLSLILPSWLAARISPAETLRYE